MFYYTIENENYDTICVFLNRKEAINYIKKTNYKILSWSISNKDIMRRTNNNPLDLPNILMKSFGL